MSSFISQLFQKVDTLGSNFTQNTYQALASAMGPVFTLLLTLYVIFWGWSFWQGRGDTTASGMAFRLFRVFIVYVLAMTWGDFQTFVYDVVNQAPSAVGNVIITNIGDASSAGTSTSNIEQSISNIYLVGVDAASKIVSNAGITNPGPYIYGSIVWIVVALFVGFTAFLVIFAKIIIWVMLALAPIFTVMMLYGFTTRYFSGWLSVLVQFVVVQILVYAVAGFYLSLIKDVVQALANSNSGVTTGIQDIAPVVLVGLIGVFLVSQLIPVSQAIAGGAMLRFTALGAALASAHNLNPERSAVGRALMTRYGLTRMGRLRAVGHDRTERQYLALQDRRAAEARMKKTRDSF